MKLKIIAIAITLALSAPAFAQVHVSGYTRRDGTYVQPHVRSAPNSTRSDNYGPSRQSSYDNSSSYYAPTYVSPYSRDQDHDGLSNQYDQDDDNDGIGDDYEPNY
jgi:hypothetical protein